MKRLLEKFLRFLPGPDRWEVRHGTPRYIVQFRRGLARLLAAREAERRNAAAEAQALARQRILDAAQVDPDTLSEQGQRILDWLAEWDKPTIDGLVELLTAARLGTDVGRHKADIDRKRAAYAVGADRLDAALAHFDAKFGDRHRAAEDGGPEVEL